MDTAAIDEAIAIQIMHYSRCGHWGCGPANSQDCYHDPNNNSRDVKYFHPTTNHEQLWTMVIPYLQKKFSRIEVHAIEDGFLCQLEVHSGEVNEHYVASREAASPGLAVCLAVLQAFDIQI